MPIDAPQVSFAPTGGLRNETVDSTGVFNAAKQGARSFKDAQAAQAKSDANERRKNFVLEDSDADISQLEDAFERSQSISEFVISEPDRGPGTEAGFVTQLRRQGGNAAIAAELASRRAQNTRLRNANAEDIPFLQAQYKERGAKASGGQFLADLATQEAAENKSIRTEIESAVKNDLGMDLVITNDAEFIREWNTPGGQYADVQLVLAETQDAALQVAANEANPDGVALRIGSWINTQSNGLHQTLLKVSDNASRPEVEARAEEAIQQMQVQFEAKAAFLTAAQQTTYRAQLNGAITFARRIADGSATRAEISTIQARLNLTKTRAESAKLKADKQLTEAQLSAQNLKTTRENLKHAVEIDEQLRKIESDLIIADTRPDNTDTSKLPPMQRLFLEDRDAFDAFRNNAYEVIVSHGQVLENEASDVDIGAAGQVSFSGDLSNAPVKEKIDTVTGYLTAFVAGNDPFKDPIQGEQGLRLMANFGAQEIAKLSPEQRSQAFAQLAPIMNSPEFAAVAAQAPRVFEPWTNLVLAETHQKAANMLGELSKDLHRDPEYRSAILAVKPQIESRVARGGDIRRAQFKADPSAFDNRVNPALGALTLNLDNKAVDEFVDNISENGSGRYLNFLGRKGWNSFVKDFEKIKEESPESAKDVDAIIAAGNDYYDGQKTVIQARMLNASNITDTYESLRDAIEVDQESFDNTGVYSIRVSNGFRDAFSEFPSVIRAAEKRVSLHNNGNEMQGIRTSLGLTKNATGAPTVQAAYEMFRVARPNQRNLSLLPTGLQDTPQEGIQ